MTVATETTEVIGELSILNVFGGDTKIIFDKDNVAETIRAKRIIKDMLKRGYMLCVLDKDGKWERAYDFDESTGEYLIADLVPEGDDDGQASTREAQEEAPAAPAGKKRGRPRRVAADSSKAVSVPRVAGG